MATPLTAQVLGALHKATETDAGDFPRVVSRQSRSCDILVTLCQPPARRPIYDFGGSCPSRLGWISEIHARSKPYMTNLLDRASAGHFERPAARNLWWGKSSTDIVPGETRQLSVCSAAPDPAVDACCASSPVFYRRRPGDANAAADIIGPRTASHGVFSPSRLFQA